MKRIRILALLAVAGFSLGAYSCQGDKTGDSSDGSSVNSSVDSSADSSSSSSSSVVDEPDNTIRSEKEPGDFNIYLFTMDLYRNREYLYGWDSTGTTIEFASSTATIARVDGIPDNYTFIPFYINFDKEYEVGDSYNAQGTRTWSLNSDLSNLLDGVLFKNSDGSSKTGDFEFDNSKLVKDEDGHYNLFLWEGHNDEYGIPANMVYYSIDEFNAAIDNNPEPSETIDPATQTEASDYNIYFKPASGHSFEDRNYFYAWGLPDGDPLLHSPVSAPVSLTEGDVTVDGLIPFYFSFDVVYGSPKGWSGDDSLAFRFTSDSLIENCIFRNSAGTSQTADIAIDNTQIVPDSDGHYNVYILETEDTTDGKNVCSIYYSLADLSAAVAE